MIDIYTEKKESKDWIIQNDLYFNLNTGNEEMTQNEKELIQQVDDAKLTSDKHIEFNSDFFIHYLVRTSSRFCIFTVSFLKVAVFTFTSAPDNISITADRNHILLIAMIYICKLIAANPKTVLYILKCLTDTLIA